MSIDIDGILNATSSHAAALGRLSAVVTHEPKQAPATGHMAAIWVDKIAPFPAQSGANTTTVILVLMVRIYQSMNYAPLDNIDPEIVKTADLLCASYTTDFDFGLTDVEIDILGRGGQGQLQAQGGYLDIDGKMMRIMDITVPLVINDVWNQVR